MATDWKFGMAVQAALRFPRRRRSTFDNVSFISYGEPHMSSPSLQKCSLGPDHQNKKKGNKQDQLGHIVSSVKVKDSLQLQVVLASRANDNGQTKGPIVNG